ncbi:unnamed protein product [Darwinula stevensoni]|uniref:14-3-3 domain-containing protein n=1 Tax=Darwinula stevensoni TaxID=69355 RepID=A0A7R9A4Q9_9CRUS|nr:unnamed protein product [Darwinula stevensoni]CAG0890503.1 unnamed protein product [Darwinula stevensoni]
MGVLVFFDIFTFTMTGLQKLVLIAKFAQQAVKWYDEMAAAMKKMTETGVELSNEERNLLSVAYKNVAEQEQELAKEKILKELQDTCYYVQDLLNKYLIPKCSNNESKVFYLTMKGGLNWYMAEVATGDSRLDVMEESLKA